MNNLTRKDILALLLIAAVGIIIYINSITTTFLWDDEPLIKDNVYIKSFSHIPKIFTTDIGRGSGRKSNSYRPVQILTYAIDYSLWGLEARGYHIVNILLHIFTALCLYWLVNMLFESRFLAFFTSAFFAAHPIHTEAVAYIAGRADPLALLFMLLAFVFYIKADKKAYLILAVIAYTLSLLSRESSLILCALVLLYHYTFKKKIDWRAFLSILALSIAYIITRALMIDYIVPRQLITTTFLERVPGFLAAFSSYIRLLILPMGLHMEYGNKLFSFTDPDVIAGVVLLYLMGLYLWKKRRNTVILFSISWFLVTLLPSSNLYPINAYMAEHWLYLPSVGLFLLLSGGLEYIYRRREAGRKYVVAAAACLVVLYSFLTIMQNLFWRDAITFYERTLYYAPESARVYYNLANAYKDRGDYDKAIELYDKAINIEPDYEYAYNNFGMLFYDMGQYRKAAQLYRKAIDINPNFAEAHNNLGNALSSLGRHQEAIDSFKQSITIDPEYAYAYNNLGLTYYELKDYDKAIKLYEKAIELNPAYSYAYNNIGMVYHKRREYSQASRFFKKAADLNPDYAIAHYNMSVAYCANGQYDLAIKSCDKASALGFKVDPNLLEMLKPYRKTNHNAR